MRDGSEISDRRAGETRVEFEESEEGEDTSKVPLRIYGFGPVRVFRGEIRIRTDQWKLRERRLFLYLLTRRFAWVPTDVIFKSLWPAAKGNAAGPNLWQARRRLRQLLEPDPKGAQGYQYILTNEFGTRLDPGKGRTYDVTQFERACRRAREARMIEQKVSCLREAFDLYRGDFVEDTPALPFIAAERRLLFQSWQDVAIDLVQALAGLHHWNEVARIAQAALARDPTLQEVHCERTRALIESGRENEAREAWVEFKRLARRNRDLTPSERMRALEKRLGV